MIVPWTFSEGFAIASGFVMAGAAMLLWRQHSMRPAWGLRWLAAAMALGALTNLLAPGLFSGALKGVASTLGLLTLIVGLGSLAALAVGIRHYVLVPPRRPWLSFLALWLAMQAVLAASATLFEFHQAGDLLTAGTFIYGAALTVDASRREPMVGHRLLGLVFLLHPAALIGLAIAGLDIREARYLAALPYAMVGPVLLSTSLVRLRRELVQEMKARTEAEAATRATQAALDSSQAVQQALLQLVPVPMSLTPVADGKTQHSYWNPAWYRCFGYSAGSKEGVAGNDFNFYVDPPVQERYLRNVLSQGQEGPVEILLRHSSGAEMLCLMEGSVLETDQGALVVSTFKDITARRASEMHLREFETMVQSADDGIILHDRGVMRSVNAAVERIFGAPAHALVGRTPVDWSPAAQSDGRSSSEAARSYVESALGGSPQRFLWQHRRANGEVFTAQVSLTRVEGIDGRLVAVLRDVTEDRANALALARSEARFESIIAVSNIGVWEFFASRNYLWCSPEYFTMLGLDPAEYPMDGRSNQQAVWIGRLHPDDSPASTKRFADYLAAGSVGMYENQFRMRHADGHWVWIWSRGQTLRNADGSLTDVTVGTHIDITQQKRAETQLLKARQMAEVIARAQLQFIVQQDRHQSFDGLLTDILALADSEYGFIGEVLHRADGQPYMKTFAITNIAWNDATRAIYEANAPKGMEFTRLKSLFGEVMTQAQPVIANAPSIDPRRCGLPDGHPPLNAFLGVPVFHGEEMVAMFGISNRPGGYDEDLIDYLRPLTATIGQLVVAHRTQIKQQETELRLNSISNNLPGSMVYQIDSGEDGRTRRFTYLSAGIEHLHGLSREAVLRDAGLLYAQIHPEDLPLLAAKEADCVQTMKDLNIEYRGRGPGGEERWYYLSSTPTCNAERHIVWDGIEVDITERKESERQLAELNLTLESRVEERTRSLTQALDDLNRTQQDLIQSEKLAALGGMVAGIAHELNTPIGNAVTVASTLADAGASMREAVAKGLTRAALNEFLDTVSDAGGILSRNLARAADLVTSFKQVAVDQSNHQRRDFDLQDLLSEVQIIMAPSLRKSHVALRTDLRDNVRLDSFPGALTQVLMILINNAITHAFDARAGGTVSISASSEGTARNARVQIVVADDGAGIAPASLGRIFEPFFTTKLGKGGSGLGLHIAYNIVSGSLGGRIHAESELGKGTRITLDLPSIAPQATTVPDRAP